MTSRARAWQPLHIAIGWALTRDENFCAEIVQNPSSAQRTFCASLQLESAMIEAGCLKLVNEILQLDPPTRTVEIQTHRLVPGYAGRFRFLAEDYDQRGRRDYTDSIAQVPHHPESERQRVSLLDYLIGRWHETFREIADHIADGHLRARGVAIDGERRSPNGDLPAASVNNAMCMDVKGIVWEGPQAIWGEQPRRWVEVEVNWADLLECFPLNDTLAFAAVEQKQRRQEQAAAEEREFGFKSLPAETGASLASLLVRSDGDPSPAQPKQVRSTGRVTALRKPPKQSFEKIKAAIEAEVKDTGKPFPPLRPVERNKRISDRMRVLGLKEQEIPKERTFREYFNNGPGKPAKSG